MQGQPLSVEAPEPEAMPPTVPDTENVPNEPQGFNEAALVTKERKTRTREMDEFKVMDTIRTAFERLPSSDAKRRVWEWVTSWLGENTRETVTSVTFGEMIDNLRKDNG